MLFSKEFYTFFNLKQNECKNQSQVLEKTKLDTKLFFKNFNQANNTWEHLLNLEGYMIITQFWYNRFTF